MKYLTISNSGEITDGALVLMGASTKDGDSSKIGFFGSGNKYAIAKLLRDQIDFHIYSGVNRIAITTRPVMLSNSYFEQICFNGEPSSLTTRMGPDWRVWYALREFISNAKDEGGYDLETVEVNDTGELTRFTQEGRTTIFVACDQNEEVAEFVANQRNYILPATVQGLGEYVVSEHGRITIIEHENENDPYRLYRKGICILNTYDNDKSLYDYDFEHITINESRIRSYSYEELQGIARVLAKCDNVDVIRNFLKHNTSDDYIESNLYWHYVHEAPSAAWLEVIGKTRLYRKSWVQYLPHEDTASGFVLGDKLFDYLLQHAPELNFFNRKGAWSEAEDAEVRTLFQNKLEHLRELGFQLDLKEFQIVLFDSPDVMAQVESDSETVLFSMKHPTGDEEVATTILEEDYHLKGFGDGSRAFERRLMGDLYKARLELQAYEKDQALVKAIKALLR